MDLRLEKTIKEIFSNHYAAPCSVRGWLFASLVDCEYVDSSLEKKQGRHAVLEKIVRPAEENLDAIKKSSEHIERINNCKSTQQKYEMLESLTELNTMALIGDSFTECNDSELYEQIKNNFPENHLNIIIIGAGLTGLTLASSLKLAFKKNINILVIENRVYEQHYKKPYSRRWISHIPLSLLNGMIDDDISKILSEAGDGNYIGVTFDIYESLMLLSCRRMGVKFLFSNNYDLSFVADSDVQAIFDASGNRFNKIDFPKADSPVTIGKNIETKSLNSNNEKIAPYGIKIINAPDNNQITVGSHNNIFFPLHNNERMKIAMLKLTHVPVRLYGSILKYIVDNNNDNKFYIWPGNLRKEVNQAIVIINLKKEEYERLCDKVESPMNIVDAIQDQSITECLDGRVMDIFAIISNHSEKSDKINIEPPFLFEPYLIDFSGNIECLYGKPIIRIGDSIYNGNVKHGNGFGPHLFYLKHIQNAFMKNFNFS